MATLAMRRLPYVVRPGAPRCFIAFVKSPGEKSSIGPGSNNKIVSRAAWIQASTERERDEIIAAGVTTPVRVIAQGVESPPPCELPKRTERYVLFLSRVAKKKGISHLLRAMSKVLRPTRICAV